MEQKTNKAGKTGLILSVLCFLLGWTSVAGWLLSAILWILALVFSIIGVCNRFDRISVWALALTILYRFVFWFNFFLTIAAE